ncbi:hypothetical protein PRIPAC_80470 [Pristionchus pacificus]|uniref:Uncharacterized protein n=1 Tax=Pristionchus pacificus TaxID=54126 RepID=A0A2A6BX40_PRIPA|nr:hypothetical protein PRIPAC_80470 [Pristionchus pacificus]|eukprot:PDM70416.1 hypothetical protein PRIPAC_46662 [Pristionchus pacificus]
MASLVRRLFTSKSKTNAVSRTMKTRIVEYARLHMSVSELMIVGSDLLHDRWRREPPNDKKGKMKLEVTAIGATQARLFELLLCEQTTLMYAIKPFFLNLIEERKIEKLSLAIMNNHITNPIKTLRDLSTRVRVLDLINIGKCMSDYRFFGLCGSIEWAPILTEMLSNKLDKLRLRGEKDRMYMQERDIDALVERLPTLGKIIWFEINYRSYQFRAVDTKVQDCIVKKERITLETKLSIKHVSREFETF